MGGAQSTALPPGQAFQSSPSAHALVLFTGKTDIAWLRILRPGFRHCLVLLPAEGGWVGLDPRSNKTDLIALPPYKPAELAAWLRSEGYRVLTADLPSQDPSGSAHRGFELCGVGEALSRDTSGGLSLLGSFTCTC
jgi:hypothetical protein